MTPTITLQQKVIEGTQKGPNLLILGGVHGDEFESMAAIRRLLNHLDPTDLRGHLTAIPVVNEAAYWRGQRTAEDGLDLARTCPGPARRLDHRAHGPRRQPRNPPCRLSHRPAQRRDRHGILSHCGVHPASR